MTASEPRMVVLVVEDQTLVRMFMADFLDEAGFKVFEAVNADEALTVLQARPDGQAVVTDIEMPGSMNGVELVQVIRERWPGSGLSSRQGGSALVLTTCRTGSRFSPSLFSPRLLSASFGSWPPRRWLRRPRP